MRENEVDSERYMRREKQNVADRLTNRETTKSKENEGGQTNRKMTLSKEVRQTDHLEKRMT